MITGIPTIFFFVKDLGRSVRFYRDVLGLSLVREGEADARFDVGGFHLVIHEDLEPGEFVKWKANPHPRERGWGVYLTLRSDDPDADYARLKRHDVDFICEPMTMPWGLRMFLLHDPDGYILEVSKPVEGETP
ncbi:MAG: VOC family protein [Nitrospinota bacterium]